MYTPLENAVSIGDDSPSCLAPHSDLDLLFVRNEIKADSVVKKRENIQLKRFKNSLVHLETMAQFSHPLPELGQSGCLCNVSWQGVP